MARRNLLANGRLRQAAIVPLLAAATTLSAAVPLTWVRAEPQSKTFSIETPCSLEKVAQLAKTAPERLGSLESPNALRVLCILEQEKAVFTAILQRYPAKPGSPTLFSLISQRAAEDPEGKKMTRAKIDGRDALLNREADGDAEAQTALIDLRNEGVIILNVGVLEGNAFSKEEKAAVIDTFTNSLKVSVE